MTSPDELIARARELLAQGYERASVVDISRKGRRTDQRSLQNLRQERWRSGPDILLDEPLNKNMKWLPGDQLHCIIVGITGFSKIIDGDDVGVVQA